MFAAPALVGVKNLVARVIRVTSFDELMSPLATPGAFDLCRARHVPHRFEPIRVATTSRSSAVDVNALVRIRREPIMVEFLARQRIRGGRDMPIDYVKFEELRSKLPPRGARLFRERAKSFQHDLKPWVLDKYEETYGASEYLHAHEVQRLRDLLRWADSARKKKAARAMKVQQLEKSSSGEPFNDAAVKSATQGPHKTRFIRIPQEPAAAQAPNRTGDMISHTSAPAVSSASFKSAEQTKRQDESSSPKAFWRDVLNSLPDQTVAHGATGSTYATWPHHADGLDAHDSATSTTTSPHYTSMYDRTLADIRKHLFDET